MSFQMYEDIIFQGGNIQKRSATRTKEAVYANGNAFQ